MAKSSSLFSQKNFIVDIQLGSKYPSILSYHGNCLKTRIAFISIIPYPSKDVYIIYTCITSFQDILS